MNAGSGRREAGDARVVIERELKDAGREYRFALVENPQDLAAIAAEAAQQAKARGGVLVVAGGDGTVNAVANAAYRAGCPLGVVPLGTFNYFGRAHGIPLEPADAVRALLAARPQPVQAGLVNDRLFLVNASLGLYPQVLEDREAYKQQLGRKRWVALLSGLSTLMHGHRHLRLQIEHQASVRQVLTPTLFIANNPLQLERIGIPEAPALEHGRLVALMLRPVSLPELLWLMVRGAFGKLGEADQVISFAFGRIVVRPRLHRRLKVAADGEIFWADAPIEFKVAPEPLYLMKTAPDARGS
jgi:diacylglycerol kinase family enzyme